MRIQLECPACDKIWGTDFIPPQAAYLKGNPDDWCDGDNAEVESDFCTKCGRQLTPKELERQIKQHMKWLEENP